MSAHMRFELFGRLKNHGAPPMQATAREPPFDKAKELASQGVPEADIIKALKDAGYSFREIDEALNAAVKTGVGGPPYSGDAPRDESAQESPEPEFERAPQQFEPSPAFPNATPLSEGAGGVNAEELEEIVDAIAEEKIRDLKAALEKSDASVKDISEKIKAASSALDATKAHGDETSADAERKIGELRAKVEELEPKILGLERAFKDIMPNLVDSVREVKEAMHSMRERSGTDHVREEAPQVDAEEDDFAPGPMAKKSQGAAPYPSQKMQKREFP